ncbi:protein Spindly-B-like isoform X2 [Stigmatopora nigra]
MSYTATFDEIHHLEDKLRQMDAQVQEAAQAGLELLNQITEMQTRFEEFRMEMTSALEDLKQDKYTLQKEMVLRTQQIKSLHWEAENMEKHYRRHMEDEKEKLQTSHQRDVNELNNKVVSFLKCKDQIMLLQSSLDESRMTEEHLKENLEMKTEVLNNKMEELRILNEDTESLPLSELVDVRNFIELENIKLELERKQKESQHTEQRLKLINSSLQQNLKLTIDERNKEAATWYQTLEKSREMNRELQAQLSTVQQQSQDPNSKGNSVFAELADKSDEMEKDLKNMKVLYESLQTQYDFNKQLQRMKVHIATLMQLRCSKADHSQMERLQSLLSVKNDEIHNLMIKSQRLEKVEMLLKAQRDKPPCSEIGNGQEETYYIDLLKMQRDSAMKDLQHLEDELSLERMKSFSESQKVLQLERKLFTNERLLKQAQCDKIQLQLQVEDLQENNLPKKTTELSQRKENEKITGNPLSSFEGTQPNGKQILKKSDFSHTVFLCPETGFDMETELAKNVKFSEENSALNPISRCQNKCEELEKQVKDLLYEQRVLRKDKADITRSQKRMLDNKDKKVEILMEQVESQQEAAERHKDMMEHLEATVDQLEARIQELNTVISTQVENLENQSGQLGALDEKLVKQKQDQEAAVRRLKDEAERDKTNMIAETMRNMEVLFEDKMTKLLEQEREQNSEKLLQLQKMLGENMTLWQEKDVMQKRELELFCEVSRLQEELVKKPRRKLCRRKMESD